MFGPILCCACMHWAWCKYRGAQFGKKDFFEKISLRILFFPHACVFWQLMVQTDRRNSLLPSSVFFFNNFGNPEGSSSSPAPLYTRCRVPSIDIYWFGLEWCYVVMVWQQTSGNRNRNCKHTNRTDFFLNDCVVVCMLFFLLFLFFPFFFYLAISNKVL